jgi:hypothetical protein
MSDDPKRPEGWVDVVRVMRDFDGGREMLHAEPNLREATELFAWLSVDHKGEGILAAGPAIGSMIQLVYHHPENAELMRKLAQDIARASGLRVRLVRFKRDEVVEEIGG